MTSEALLTTPVAHRAPQSAPLAPTEPWTVLHDFAFAYGGAERVTEAIAHGVLPHADVQFLGGDEQVVRRMGLDGRSEYVLPRGFVRDTNYRALAPTYAGSLARRKPVAGNVVASSYAFCPHVPCEGRRVVYCHSPLRQIWSHAGEYERHGNRMLAPALRGTAAYLRRLDRRAAARAHGFVATSTVVRERIQQFYGQADVPVIPPPVDLSAFHVDRSVARGDTFLWVGRIVEPYKRVALLMEAFRGLDAKLIVVGGGRDETRIKAMAPPNVEFRGPRSTLELSRLYQRAAAVLFPSADDFGIVPLEAMASGTPVIAFRGGGALDTVLEGETGVFFDEPTPASVRDGIATWGEQSWSAERIAARAGWYGHDAFASKLRAHLAEVSA